MPIYIAWCHWYAIDIGYTTPYFAMKQAYIISLMTFRLSFLGTLICNRSHNNIAVEPFHSGVYLAHTFFKCQIFDKIANMRVKMLKNKTSFRLLIQE